MQAQAAASFAPLGIRQPGVIICYDGTMNVIERDIVGAFFVSSDDKVLLGHNRAGGVYEGSLVVPGGGVEAGETQHDALRREMLEETGIDVDDALSVELVNEHTGEHEKTLRDTQERVLVRMTFYDYLVKLPQNAQDTVVVPEDDWGTPVWLNKVDLAQATISAPTAATLQKIGYLEG